MSTEPGSDIEFHDDEWGEPRSATVRRDVTISVRFSDDEIAALRERAEAAGMKVTTFIRQVALGGGDHIDRERVGRAVDAASSDLDQIRALIHGGG